MKEFGEWFSDMAEQLAQTDNIFDKEIIVPKQIKEYYVPEDEDYSNFNPGLTGGDDD